MNQKTETVRRAVLAGVGSALAMRVPDDAADPLGDIAASNCGGGW